LVIDGPPQTGKTSSLRLAISMFPFQRYIAFVDCRTQSPYPVSDELFEYRRLVIFDHVDPASFSLPDLFAVLARTNWSFIFVGPLSILPFLPPGYSPGAICFSRYTRDQIYDILRERMIEQERTVPDGFLREIARVTDHDRRQITDAIGWLESELERLEAQEPS
jgi:hypothetical protein